MSSHAHPSPDGLPLFLFWSFEQDEKDTIITTTNTIIRCIVPCFAHQWCENRTCFQPSFILTLTTAVSQSVSPFIGSPLKTAPSLASLENFRACVCSAPPCPLIVNLASRSLRSSGFIVLSYKNNFGSPYLSNKRYRCIPSVS